MRDHERILERMLAASLDAAAFERACDEVEDWERLFDLAHAHGVRGVVDHYVASAGLEVPSEVAARVRRERFFESARQRPLLGALVEIAAALDARAIVSVALKGPLLAERLYPDRSLRPSADLDLLVHAAALDDALEALRPLGFLVSDDAARESYHRAHHYHLVLVRPDLEQMVELHFRAVRAFGGSVPAEELLERSTVYESSEGPARVLEPEDELVYLAVHAAKHFAVHYKWLYDLKLFLDRHPAIDWEVARGRAARFGVSRGLAYALSELRDRLGVEVPEAATRRVGASRLALARSLVARGRGRGRGPAATALGLLFVASLGEGPRASTSVLWRGATRIAKRRAHRALPRLVPERWSG